MMEDGALPALHAMCTYTIFILISFHSVWSKNGSVHDEDCIKAPFTMALFHDKGRTFYSSGQRARMLNVVTRYIYAFENMYRPFLLLLFYFVSNTVTEQRSCPNRDWPPPSHLSCHLWKRRNFNRVIDF